MPPSLQNDENVFVHQLQVPQSLGGAAMLASTASQMNAMLVDNQRAGLLAAEAEEAEEAEETSYHQMQQQEILRRHLGWSATESGRLPAQELVGRQQQSPAPRPPPQPQVGACCLFAALGPNL